MYLLVLTTYDDDYKNKNDNTEYRHCKTKKKAEKLVIDLIYDYLDEYFAGENENLKKRKYYTMDNINELLTMIETKYVKCKFDFSIKEVNVEN
jgi:hypothetical protein